MSYAWNPLIAMHSLGPGLCFLPIQSYITEKKETDALYTIYSDYASSLSVVLFSSEEHKDKWLALIKR